MSNENPRKTASNSIIPALRKRIPSLFNSSLRSRRSRQVDSRRALKHEILESRQVMATEIFGTVYDDGDRSGTKTGPDNGLAGWTVFLDLNADGTFNAGEPSSVSNIDGDYSITGLVAGTYRVAEIPQSGWTPVTPSSRDVAVDTNKKTQVDFFNFAGGDINGTIWSDLDHDGQRTIDTGTGEFSDPPLAGWVVYLDLNADQIQDPDEPQTTTDSNGFYAFKELGTRDYEVTVVMPSGWGPTKKNDFHQTASVAPLTIATQDFGMYSSSNGSIRGIVFNDVNANGIRDIDTSTGRFAEPGLEGWTIFIDSNANLSLDAGELSAVTDTDGEYIFTSLVAGDYEVVEVLPAGWSATPGTDSSQTVTVFGGETTSANDFASFTVLDGSISGLVWNDLNRNGLRDYDTLTGTYLDPVLPGWTIYLDLNRSRTIDPGEPVATTGADGRYLFPDLQVGEYQIVEVLPTGWETSGLIGDNQAIVVFSGAESVAADFSNYDASASSPGSVHGVVWNDVNGNGVRDAGDNGLAGWVVYIDQNANGLLEVSEPQTTTPIDGSYSFNNLTPGTIRIGLQSTIGWRATAPFAYSRSVSLRGGQSLTGLDFGQTQLKDSSISGVVFNDSNKDGLRDATEAGISNILVYLDLNNNETLDAAEPFANTSGDLFYTPDVNEAGSYSFSHLATGTYAVRAVVPAILSATPVAELLHTVTLTSVENRTGVNTAARYRPTEIRGTKFDDVNSNHLREVDEPVMVGETIFVDLDRDDVLDADEPSTTTAEDGTYSFVGLPTGSYVVRSVVASGYSKSSPTTLGGVLWPSGNSNPAVGDVTPTLIEASLAKDQRLQQTVSITLPNSGALTDLVDVFLLFDDTGSFTNNSPIVRAAFPDIISRLQTSLPGIDLGFGVGRFEEYGNFGFEYGTGRPFTLNQPIVAANTSGYLAAIQSALNRTAPGYGGDQPETDIEALYQLVTGKGFDGNNNGSVLDSGPAGLAATQLSPGNSGDVPSFASFTADPANGVLPAAGNLGGAGFRAGALPIVLLATDTGIAYQPKGESVITGANGSSIPVSSLTQTSRPSTPFNSGAGIQETVTALNALGALVIGLGTNPGSTLDPRQQLESLSKLTGATNQTTSTISNGTADPIAPGDPLYFQIASGFGASVANGVVSAIQNAVTNVAVDIDVRCSDPRVTIINHTGIRRTIGAGMNASFDIEFVGDGAPRRFDLQFVRAGTSVVLGSIPVVLGTPITGDHYQYDELEDGEIEIEDDFSDTRSSSIEVNQAPSFVAGSNVLIAEDAGAIQVTNWATSISPGPASESGQSVDFQLTNDNATLFLVAPSISPNGTLNFTPTANANGTAVLTVTLHDNGGTANGGVDTSSPHLLTITISPVNDAPTVANPISDVVVESNASDINIDLSTTFTDVDNVSLAINAMSAHPSLVTTSLSGNVLTLHVVPNTQGIAGVTVTATDADGLSVATTFSVTVGNSLPVLTASGPIDGFQGVSGQLRFIRLDAADATNNLGRSFTYEANWDDGSPLEIYSGSEHLTISHRYATAGNYSASFRTIDPDGGASDWMPLPLNILNTESQGDWLAIGGTTGDDSLRFTPGAVLQTATLVLNGTSLGQLAVPTGGFLFFGNAGNDATLITGAATSDTVTVDGPSVRWQDGGSWLSPVAFALDSIESLTLNTDGGNDSVSILSGLAKVDLGTGIDSLSGPKINNNLWQIQSTGGGQLNGNSFAGVESIIGGDLTDTFVFSAIGKLTGSVDGGAGTDKLDYSLRSTTVAVNLSKNTATSVVGATNIESAIGGTATNDTFTAANGSNLWLLQADGTALLNSTGSISGFETLAGGGLDDTFSIQPGVVTTPVLNGGGGIDILSYADHSDAVQVDRNLRNATSVPSFSAIEQFVGGAGIDSMIGTNSTTTWTLNDGFTGTFNGGGFSSFERLFGGTGRDTFRVSTSTVTFDVDGGDSNDLLYGPNYAGVWSLTNVESGSLNGGLNFTNVEDMRGGTSDDQFLVSPSAGGFGAINGGGGIDSLSYADWMTPVAIDLAVKSAPAIQSFVSIEKLIGSDAHDTLAGANVKTSWTVSSTSGGKVGSIAFQSFESLIGGTADDSFSLVGGSVLNLSGGTGLDTLIGPATNNLWQISSPGGGSLNASLTFDGIENFTGGIAGDVFEVQPAGAIAGTLNGGSGINALSYATWTADVVINSVVGSASNIANLTSTFSILFGGSGNDTISAFPTLASVVVGNAGNDTLRGSTSGRDLVFGGEGIDQLFGLGGDDILFGGSTIYDQSASNLSDLHAEWKSKRTYLQRVENLRGGPVTGVPLNGSNLLANTPVDALLDDGEADVLTGDIGTDWFIASDVDQIVDRALSELIDSPN